MKFSFINFVFSATLLAFLYGLAVGAYEIFPYKHLKHVLNSVEQVIQDRDSLLNPDRPVKYLTPRIFPGYGTTIAEESGISPGFTLLSGFFDGMPGLKLIRLDGTVVQQWPAPFHDLFKDVSHITPPEDIPASNWNAAIHGMHIFPDGSVVFNFDGKGLIKLDRCGNPEWRLNRMAHHSIHHATDSSLWIPVYDYHEKTPKHDLFQTPYREDIILKVSEDGEVLLEKSVIDILIENDLYSLLVSNGAFKIGVTEKDVLHLNDLEELTPDLARHFPNFEAGDLLMSFRHLNMLLVADPDNWRVKWYQMGPWLRQHDPDFHADGTISVYNNNSDDTTFGSVFGGSSIMTFRPGMFPLDIDIIYGPEQDPKFFTNTQGKHQKLPNGNYLISQYSGGRAFEFNTKGKIVWQYINGYDEKDVAKISGATRYPEDYFTVSSWNCDAQ